MLNVNDIDVQLGNILPDIQNNLSKNTQESNTILGGIFGIANMAMIKKKRQLSLYFRVYAFKAVYFLNSVNFIDKFINNDETTLYVIWQYATLMKEQIFPKIYDRNETSKYFPECFSNDGEFQSKFMACVIQLITMTIKSDSGECIIPYDNRYLAYRSVKRDGFINMFIQTFAEDLLLSESLGTWEFGPNYYGSDVRSQVYQRIKYNCQNVNNYTRIIENAIQKQINR